MAENPRFLQHVLVITDPGDGYEKDFEIEHPDGCPVVCFWSPHAREFHASEDQVLRIAGAFDVPRDLVGFADPGHRDCYLQFEIENVGLDGLDLGEDPPDDGTYTPASQWSMDRWRQLPVGRYIIEGWHRRGLGLMPWGEDESEGGLTLVGPAE